MIALGPSLLKTVLTIVIVAKRNLVVYNDVMYKEGRLPQLDKCTLLYTLV
jgi:hypothetical protein